MLDKRTSAYCFCRLTEREKQERGHKKKLLQIAKEHEKARELERVQRYRMPENIKKGDKGKWIFLKQISS